MRSASSCARRLSASRSSCTLAAVGVEQHTERAGEIADLVLLRRIRQGDVELAGGDVTRLADDAAEAADEAAGEQPADGNQEDRRAGNDEGRRARWSG